MMKIWMVLGLLVAASVTAAQPKLTRGPLVQLPEPDAVTVVWRTDKPAAGAVEFGLDAGCTNGTAAEATAATEHAVSLRGLLPGTNYFYRVHANGVVLSEGNVLRTPRTATQPFRFAIIGDWGYGNASMSNIARQVNAIADLDFYLTVGDNIYQNGEAKLYDPHWFSLYGPTMRRVPVFPTLGNHDVRPPSSNAAPFLASFRLPVNGPAGRIGRDYSFDYGNAHFVALDSNPFDDKKKESRGIVDTVTDWVKRDLAATRQPWKFAFFHHPA